MVVGAVMRVLGVAAVVHEAVQAAPVARSLAGGLCALSSSARNLSPPGTMATAGTSSQPTAMRTLVSLFFFW